ncbi:MAG: DUF6677 family protein [Phycisphaerae bacterium]
MASKTRKSAPIPLVAVLLAWLVPGSGHVYLGRPVRGVVIFVVIALTFWSGIAMGGVMTVDPRNERWWFVADMLTGVHGLVGWQRYNSEHARLEQELDKTLHGVPHAALRRLDDMDRLLAQKNLALVAPGDTVARAYCGVVGLLNLMVIFDALMLSLAGISGETPPEARTEQEAPSP